MAFLLSTQFVSAQKIDTSNNKSPRVMYDFYMQKHKTNTITGWTLLGSGVVMFTIGGKLFADNGFGIFSSNNKSDVGAGIMLAGVVTGLASIPFLISARNNKMKADLSLKTGSVALGDRSPGNFNYAAISLKIKF